MGKEITMERGIKQGCPLAMYLYIKYIEPLHLKIQRSIKRIKLGNSHLQMTGYVDDVNIYTETPK